MLEVRLKRAFEPEEAGETACPLCGTGFVAGIVSAHVADLEGSILCPACVAHLARINPAAFPAPEEIAEANRRFTTLAYPSVEAIMEIEASDDEEAWAAMEAAYKACWVDRGDLLEAAGP